MKQLLYTTLTLIALNTTAQTLSYDFYTYRLDNMYNVNPAYAGKGDGINIILSAQSQNKGVAFANKNLMAGVYSKFSKKQALGGKMIYDTRGAFQNIKADLSYAYIAQIADKHSLSFGLSAGIYNRSLNVSKIENYQALDISDPTLSSSFYNQTQFSAGAGLLYTLKGLELSVSLPHMISTSQPFNSYVNASAFYTINAGTKFKVTPWISYQNIPVTKSVTSFMLKTSFKDFVWLQLGYQTNQSMNMALGLRYENIGLAYGYRMSNKEFNSITNGMQEITLTYKILSTKNPNALTNSSNPTIKTSLNDILANLERLSSTPINNTNRADIKNELQKLKEQLQNAEADNSTPEKAKQVEAQLKLIDEKLKLIENNLR